MMGKSVLQRGACKALLLLCLLFIITPACAAEDNRVAEIRAKALAGDSFAQMQLGDLYFVGNLGVTKNIEDAKKWLTASALQNNPSAMRSLAAILENTDPEAALKWYRKSAELSYDPYSFYLLFDNERVGLKRDNPEAIVWLTKSAENNNYFAQMDLARRFEGGIGVEKNIAKAFFWTWIATMAGQINVWKTDDVEEKYPSVTETNKKAATRILATQLTPAQIVGVEHMLKWWFDKWNGLASSIPPEFERAYKGSIVDIEEIKTKASNGDRFYASMLAHLYFFGANTIPQDRQEAYFWYTLSSQSSHHHLLWLKKILPPEQRDAADKRIEEWQQSHKK